MNFLSTSNSKSKAEHAAMNVPAVSLRARFFAKYHRQSFALPDSIMFNIALNPTTSELYQKLVDSCKYFFVKNPNLVVRFLCYYEIGWSVDYGHKPFDFNKLACKFWINDQFRVIGNIFANNQNIFSSMFSKLFRCDAKHVTINDQNISYHDLSILISSAERILFENITVKQEDGSVVPLEKIVEIAVKAESINISYPVVTSDTMKDLVKLPRFLSLGFLSLYYIPEIFDLELFYSYVKKNKTTKFWFRFDNSVSEVYKNRLEEIVDEIIATKTIDYKPPHIDFAGLDLAKLLKLDRIYPSL